MHNMGRIDWAKQAHLKDILDKAACVDCVAHNVRLRIAAAAALGARANQMRQIRMPTAAHANATGESRRGRHPAAARRPTRTANVDSLECFNFAFSNLP
jgi:hypothetical protein